MVLGNGIGYLLEQGGFSGFGLRHNHAALAFADRGKKVEHAGGIEIGLGAEAELLFGEERRKVLKSHTVADFVGGFAVYIFYLQQGKVFFTFFGWADLSFDGIAGFEAEEFDLRGRHIDIVGACQVIVVGRAQEAVAVLHDFQHTRIGNDAIKIADVDVFLKLLGLLIRIYTLLVFFRLRYAHFYLLIELKRLKRKVIVRDFHLYIWFLAYFRRFFYLVYFLYFFYFFRLLGAFLNFLLF